MTRRSDPRTARLPVPAASLPEFTPVPSQTNRADGWTPQRQRDFIEALADTGSVKAACRHVDMSAEGAYRIRRLPEGASFAAAWEAALALGVQRLEDVAMDRAINGVEEPFYVYGKLAGTRKRYNDRLLMFMLRNRAPERFGTSVNGASLKGLNAVGKMEKKRLKAKWRKQWDAEQRAGKHQVSPAEVRANIDRKIEAIRRQFEAERARSWERMSEETRAAWERFVDLRDRDFAQLAFDEEQRAALREGPRETINADPKHFRKWAPKPPEPRKTVHRLTDDGWD